MSVRQDTLHYLKSGSCASVIGSNVDLNGDCFSQCESFAKGAFHFISFLVPFLSVCLFFSLSLGVV